MANLPPKGSAALRLANKEPGLPGCALAFVIECCFPLTVQLCGSKRKEAEHSLEYIIFESPRGVKRATKAGHAPLKFHGGVILPNCDGRTSIPIRFNGRHFGSDR